MFVYEKKLQYPVKIKNCNPKLASVIISQYGGPDGELGASLRYLSQRYAMPFPELKGLLTDIGTEGSFLHIGSKPLISLGFSEVVLKDTVGSFLHTSSFAGDLPSNFRFRSRRFSRIKTHFCGKRFKYTSIRLSLWTTM